jgi:DNA-binding HxlR family transcriptional regulator
MKGKNSHKSIRALTRAVDLVGQGWSRLIIDEAISGSNRAIDLQQDFHIATGSPAAR